MVLRDLIVQVLPLQIPHLPPVLSLSQRQVVLMLCQLLNLCQIGFLLLFDQLSVVLLGFDLLLHELVGVVLVLTLGNLFHFFTLHVLLLRLVAVLDFFVVLSDPLLDLWSYYVRLVPSVILRLLLPKSREPLLLQLAPFDLQVDQLLRVLQLHLHVPLQALPLDLFLLPVLLHLVPKLPGVALLPLLEVLLVLLLFLLLRLGRWQFEGLLNADLLCLSGLKVNHLFVIHEHNFPFLFLLNFFLFYFLFFDLLGQFSHLGSVHFLLRFLLLFYHFPLLYPVFDLLHIRPLSIVVMDPFDPFLLVADLLRELDQGVPLVMLAFHVDGQVAMNFAVDLVGDRVLTLS